MDSKKKSEQIRTFIGEKSILSATLFFFTGTWGFVFFGLVIMHSLNLIIITMIKKIEGKKLIIVTMINPFTGDFDQPKRNCFNRLL
jgi:hypothetical protein